MFKLRALLLFLVLPLTLLGCGEQSAVQKGRIVPDFELVSLEGEKVARDHLEGKPVVINFWATWCGPCVKEIPALQEVDRSGEAEVVAISLDEQGEAAVRSFVEQHGIDYTVLLNGSEVFEAYEGWAIPYTLVLDSSLEVVSIHHGLVSRRTLERNLQRARSS